MGKEKRWNDNQLREAVANSFSIREIINRLGLKPAGGNYQQVPRRITELKLDVTHLHGRGWRRGKTIPKEPVYSFEEILVKNSRFRNTHKLKLRLITAGLKPQKCEECGWMQVSEDGRIPIELDHVNGNRLDNRIENLRILCPNCHSLKPTHRGKNKKRRGGETGQTRSA